MDVTRQEIRDARHPNCGWAEADMDSALDARFPSTDPIDFAALCTSWADDSELSVAVLRQCVLLAVQIGQVKDPGGFVRPTGILHDPRGALNEIATAYTAP